MIKVKLKLKLKPKPKAMISFNAPLSLPLVVSSYLVDALNSGIDIVGSAPLVSWVSDLESLSAGGISGDDIWSISAAGLTLNARGESEISGIDSSLTGAAQAKFVDDRIITVAQASGYSYPKWGLDLTRMRIFVLFDSNHYTAPAYVAEDMMERIKMAINSINGREIWRINTIPSVKEVDGAKVLDWEEIAASPYDLQKAMRHLQSGIVYVEPILYRICKRLGNGNVEKDGFDSGGDIPLPPLEAGLEVEYEHIANWSSTVLDGNTVQRVPAGARAGRRTYTSFSVDFLMYVELLHPSVLGYRQKFVDPYVSAGA